MTSQVAWLEKGTQITCFLKEEILLVYYVKAYSFFGNFSIMCLLPSSPS